VQIYLQVKIAIFGFSKKIQLVCDKKAKLFKEGSMPVADYKISGTMIDQARENHFAYPAINTNLPAATAVLKGRAESKRDCIIQISTGTGAFASGALVKTWPFAVISRKEILFKRPHAGRVSGQV
jgi:hypothetical protein